MCYVCLLKSEAESQLRKDIPFNVKHACILKRNTFGVTILRGIQLCMCFQVHRTNIF